MPEIKSTQAVKTSAPGATLKPTNMSAQNSGASQPAKAEIQKGTRVRITGTHYATGQSIPASIKRRVYTVGRVDGNKALLQEIVSFVALNDLQPLSQSEVNNENALEMAKQAGKDAGVKGSAETEKARDALYDPNQSVFDNTVRAVWAVETGSNPHQIADIGDNAGLSVGAFQLTEKYTLYDFIVEYRNLGGTVTIPDEIVQKLKQTRDDKEHKLRLSQTERETLRQLLLQASHTDEQRFVQAQLNYWQGAFFDPCTKLMRAYGLDPDTLDPRIAVLIYDHQNSGAGHNEATLKILARKHGNGKTIDQSKLTLENVAIAIQEQFSSRGSKEYENGWHNRVASIYAGMKASEFNGAAPKPTSPTNSDPSSTTSSQTVAAQEPQQPQQPQQAPANSGAIVAGSKVKIVGTNYATGQKIPNWVKSNVYTVRSVSGDNALIDEIVSRVLLKDLVLVSGATAPQASKSDEQQQSGASNDSNENSAKDSVPTKDGFSGLASQVRNFGTKNSNARKSKVSKITIHHMAVNMGAYDCANMHYGGSGASANYYIGSDGKICGGVREDRRAWTSSSGTNDHQAITFEVANCSGEPDWKISEAAYDSMIALARDICSRYGITAKYDGTSGASLTTHNMFAPTACPGPYIKGKLKDGTIERDINGGGGSAQADKAEQTDKKEHTASAEQTDKTDKQTTTPQGGASPTTTNKSPLDTLLASHPEVKTNQHLINLFYRMSDNTYGGASAVARTYGVNLNALTYNRNASVSGKTATLTPTQTSSSGGATVKSAPAVPADGVPCFKQGDPRWGANPLGVSGTIASIGCAMTSTAMVLSKLRGSEYYPNELNDYLMKNGGYDGNNIYWKKAAESVEKEYKGDSYTKNIVDDELTNGRPMVVSVKNQGHWVCIAGRNEDGTYIIHDPADGEARAAHWDEKAGRVKVDGYTLGYELRRFA